MLKVLGSQGRTADTGRGIGARSAGLLGPVILGMNVADAWPCDVMGLGLHRNEGTWLNVHTGKK